MSDLVGAVTDSAVHAGPTPSAQAWFAGGERVGYDPLVLAWLYHSPHASPSQLAESIC
jgi:hypothetical protein